MNKLLLLLIFLPFIGKTQVVYSTDSIIDNTIGLNESNFQKWSINSEGVIFFCPLSNLKDSNYIKGLDFFKNEIRLNKTNIKFTLVFYRENDINNSLNPYLKKIFSKDSIINQLQCFVITKNNNNVTRAKKKLSNRFKIKSESIINNIYKIELEDVACPKDLATKTSMFIDMINEIFNPLYTSDEKIEILEQKVKDLEIAFIKLSNELKVNKKQEERDFEEDKKDKKK
jgi:hypothetical protein